MSRNEKDQNSKYFGSMFQAFRLWGGRSNCGEKRKAARGARVVEREDWERGEETPVKLILKSSCRPLLTADSGCDF